MKFLVSFIDHSEYDSDRRYYLNFPIKTFKKSFDSFRSNILLNGEEIDVKFMFRKLTQKKMIINNIKRCSKDEINKE